MAPGPLLTIFGNQPPSTALPDQSNVNLTKFNQMMVNKIRSIQREVESWLVCAYRRQTFSRVHEYTQFLYKLGHSDSLLLAQTELIYHKVLVTSDRYSFSPKLALRRKLMNYDTIFLCNFTPRLDSAQIRTSLEFQLMISFPPSLCMQFWLKELLTAHTAVTS